MDSPRNSIIERFPYPVAYPYLLVFADDEPASSRRGALYFTEYQLLRMVCLPLVSQYVGEPIDERASRAVSSINKAIAAIRAPFFSDWISLAITLARQLPKVGVQPIFLQLESTLAGLMKSRAARPVGLRDRDLLNPLEAIQALRNAVAHGGLPDEDEAARHLEVYLPVLHEVLEAFDFLGDVNLTVCCDSPEEVWSGFARVRHLRGAHLGEPGEEELSAEQVEAFQQSATVLTAADGRVLPLYPLLAPLEQQEPLYLYDGHYGVRMTSGTSDAVERSYIYYLGVHHRQSDGPSCQRLMDLLERRQISFYLEKHQTAPWTIADSAADYSRHTLADLVGSKYVPECYVPLDEIERHFARFLEVPARDQWSGDVSRPRHTNGLVLAGLAGAGKTAFLARQVERLLADDDTEAGRENRNLVLFLRGNGIVPRGEGMSLFRSLAEKLGVAVRSADTKSSSRGGFSGFAELLEHLHGCWKQDRVEDRRMVVVLDALNEAPLAGTVIHEALELIGVAARFPWCKVVISLRQEWLSIWSGKLESQERSPFEELRTLLYTPDDRPSGATPAVEAPPVLTLESLSDERAEKLYCTYQEVSHSDRSRTQRIPACATPWEQLPQTTRDLLKNPLYLRLFMEGFDREEATEISTAPELFRRYVETTLRGKTGLDNEISDVIDLLLSDLSRPGADLSDDDCNALRKAWAEGLSAEEARLRLSPVEALAHEGLLRKRVREEGGGYRFLYQTVAEYLIYRRLALACPAATEPLAYWQQRASVEHVFPEYEGAFGFLLRDWAASGRTGLIARLVEGSHEWLENVLTTLLVEYAGKQYVAGQGSPAARDLTSALDGGRRTADALHQASLQASDGPFALSAQLFVEKSIALREQCLRSHPDDLDNRRLLAGGLNNLAILLDRSGELERSQALYQRSIATSDALWKANPDQTRVAWFLGAALGNLANQLKKLDRYPEAEPALRRSLEIYRQLWASDSAAVDNGLGVVGALTNLGGCCCDTQRYDEAEQYFREACDVIDALESSRADLTDADRTTLRASRAQTETCLGVLFSATERFAEARRAYEQSVETLDSLCAENPEDLRFAGGLGDAQKNLGDLLFLAAYGLHRTNQPRATLLQDAADYYNRALEVLRAQRHKHPNNIDIVHPLGGLLSNLGLFYRKQGLRQQEEAALREAVETLLSVWNAQQQAVWILDFAVKASSNLADLLRETRRPEEAEHCYGKALSCLRELLKDDAQDDDTPQRLVQLLRRRAQVRTALGRFREAEEDLREAERTVVVLTACSLCGEEVISSLARATAAEVPVGLWRRERHDQQAAPLSSDERFGAKDGRDELWQTLDALAQLFKAEALRQAEAPHTSRPETCDLDAASAEPAGDRRAQLLSGKMTVADYYSSEVKPKHYCSLHIYQTVWDAEPPRAMREWLAEAMAGRGKRLSTVPGASRQLDDELLVTLRMALDFCLALPLGAPPSAENAARTGKLAVQLGDLSRTTGLPHAEGWYRRALDQLAHLLRESSSPDTVYTAAAAALHGISETIVVEGHSGEAGTAMRHAVQTLVAAIGEPVDPVRLAGLLIRLGDQSPTGTAFYECAAETLEELGGRNDTATESGDRSNRDPGIEVPLQSVSHEAEFEHVDPRRLADMWFQLAQRLRKSAMVQERSLAVLRQTVFWWERAREADGEDLGVKSKFAESLKLLATALLDAGDRTAGKECLLQFQRLTGELAASDPQNAVYPFWIRKAQEMLEAVTESEGKANLSDD